MDIELGPIPKYEDVKINAYWSRVAIDTRFRADNYSVSDYKAHLNDCYKNPTIGMLANREYITKNPMNYPMQANANLKILKSQPDIKVLLGDIKNKISTIYPKTKHIREYIINHDRVTLNEVKKCRKYSLMDKLIVFCKKILR